MTDEYDHDVRRLLDERAIRRRLLEYCRAVDRLDSELLLGVFHPDAVLDYGSTVVLPHEFADGVLGRLRANMDATLHTIGDTLFDWVDDDTVRAETHVFAQHVRHDDEGPFLERFGGRYLDRAERRDGVWRIARRTLRVEWDALERRVPAVPADRFRRGVRDRTDLAYG